ncbi:1,4-dihydroxy-6-naphthoate synthase [Flavihumibacter sp. CACIAM 22H1]|uniref:1,4-dihydroxy-6-naphthoate synthase n=1 Tax=Flavihumibacter sp. CACIAM 22H1 TaxID=1812911 RepID=UPI0007A91672|nr:1,4-dihydroxy-6-naphthoate synthase [Flavihumibacter sp. CACIAM 22H1]KYP13966.1 MAG: 1,4-dihydroxy-6-naphthoate synthase [Flavihumibacter sp. CACIAM 22H1]
MTRIDLAFSPCPNDTFIFDALVNRKIDTGTYRFDPVLEDVQTLNEWALQGRYPLTKISYGVWPQVQTRYRLLDAGGALGFGVGPLLIARKPLELTELPTLKIAIPGKNTTAHLLFSLAFPNALHKEFIVFHEVENAVLSGKVDAGVIIHENRFTYQEKGLISLLDLGRYWEEQLHCPIPLGGIVVRKDQPEALDNLISSLIQTSIRHSWSNYPELSDFVRSHAQEMSEEVMRQHISLYVNEYSLSLGDAGRNAVQQLETIFHRIASA